LMTDPVAAAYRLDGIVTVVDALNGAAHLDQQAEAVRQVAVADILIISKADLTNTAALRQRLAALNPGAPVAEASHGVVDPAFILRAGLFEPASKIPDVAAWLNVAAFDDHAHHHGHDPNRHDARIAAFCVTLEGPLDWQGVATWLEMLVASRGENLLRVKGILNLKGHDRPVAIHAVRHLLHPPVKLTAWPEGDPRTSRLVFITCDLPRILIEDGLRAFRAATTQEPNRSSRRGLRTK
jgi:G3E family GTPase